MKRYTYMFHFVDTESEAVKMCAEYNSRATAYCRRKYPAHFTEWKSKDGSEPKYVVWYVL